MNIFICGLGLIGGSLAKAIAARTAHTVIGYNRTRAVAEDALAVGAIHKIGEPKDLCDCDLVIMGLYPAATIAFVRENLQYFKKGAILLDTCGIKTEVCEQLGEMTKGTSVRFIGGHPMAGIERSGFAYTFAELFDGAS
ncbi:MAG: prephenate dehydrogenase/arogenate dehydrogenase family protein, partial [Clostridia bacterium]|nr:prephenate dehydrogenase/arogenate dehydrogenase family protein [Clostridia bacterium]